MIKEKILFFYGSSLQSVGLLIFFGLGPEKALQLPI